MQSAIERIINNDRKARQVVAAAEQYRRDAAEALAKEKTELERKANEGLAAASKTAVERSEKNAVASAEEKRRNAEATIRKMDALYEEKKDEWIDTYTRYITEG